MNAAIIIDIRHMRCGACKIAFKDELATECKNCNAVFDRISSNHVGLADKLRTVRGEALMETTSNVDDKYPELVGG
jgi:predicted  nucleic acid-binding Zn-ribbon protein